MIELEEDFAVIELPTETVEASLSLKVFHDGEIVEVGKTLKMEDVRKAFRLAEDGYIDENAVFEVTEKGKQWLENLKKERNIYE